MIDKNNLKKSAEHALKRMNGIDQRLNEMQRCFNCLELRHPASVDRVAELCAELARLHTAREAARTEWYLYTQLSQGIIPIG